MRFAIIYSKTNPAGTNIVEQFKKLGFSPHIPIIESKNETIYAEDIDKNNEFKNIDFIVFACTHRSKDNKPSLCLHAPGNFRDAKLGGKPTKVCPTSAFIMKYLFQELNKNCKELKNKYNITMEATHHGPFIEKPCCFIEVGSTEEEWKDKKAGLAIAKTILSLTKYNATKANKEYIPSIGVGGPHYCNNFNKIQLNSKYAISHVISKYNSPITESMLKEAEQKTIEQVKELLIDWKSFKSEERIKLLQIIEDLGFSYKKTSEIKK